ncbi:hypothetical protein [Acidipropionibacterium acidipropionici]|nr:hypothetical protein [Acidipropionibacterium acidipropionici]MDN6555871.1 hypothetical protein [Acidipropionibacterium acidipropionici]
MVALIPIIVGIAVGAGSYAAEKHIKGEPIDPWGVVLNGILGGASAGLRGVIGKTLARILFGGIRTATETKPKEITQGSDD